jgi:hypothetical protein
VEVSGQLHAQAALTPRKEPLVSIGQEAFTKSTEVVQNYEDQLFKN